MSTELKPLRQFLMLAEELHFGRAAARLHITQPPLTMAIHGLEQRLGVRLFDRSRRRVALSEAGAALLPEVRALLERLDALPRLAQDAAGGMSGVLRLAFVSTIAYGPLPAWLRQFRLELPAVRLELREATLDVQVAAFARGEVDAGFVLHAPGAAPSGLQAWCALREPLVLALPEGHPLAARRQLPLRLVLGEPLVGIPRAIAPSLHDAIAAAYRDAGATLPVVQEAIQMQTLVNLVSAGLGLAWVPQSVTLLQRPGVVYRRVLGEPVRCETSLVWPSEPSATARRFVELVQRQSAPRIRSRSRNGAPAATPRPRRR